MEKTTRYAEMPQVKGGIVFSDPSYDKNVWCQYRKNFDDHGWLMKLETSRDEDGYVDATLYLGRRTLMAQLSVERNEEDQTDSISYPSYYKGEETEIGIDTARVFVGNMENFSQWAQEGSIYTAADGMFGGLIEFTCKNESKPAGYVLLCALDGNITNEDELFHTLLASFDGQEITKEQYNGQIYNLGTKTMIATEIQAAQACSPKTGPQQERDNKEL